VRVFLDTNIVLDVLLNRPGLADESEAVILRCEAAGDPMFMAWHGVATAYYLIRRGRTEAQAMSELDKLLAWVRVAEATDASLRRARTLGFGDFEDALQVVSAEACSADVIVTRNVVDFTRGRLAAMMPAQFIAQFPA
jgi:predicted nucleic acid-binding protein